MSIKALRHIKTIVCILVVVAILGFGVSCSKETPDSDSSIVEQKYRNRASPKQIEASQLTVGKTCKQEVLVSAYEEEKMKQDDVENSRSAQIFIWQSGIKKQLDQDQLWVSDLQGTCQQLLISADDALWEVVTEEILRKARREVAIELRYQEAWRFQTEFQKDPIEIDGFLIPLQTLHRDTAVIYHRLGSYSAGPLINTQGKKITDQLNETLKKQGLIDK